MSEEELKAIEGRANAIRTAHQIEVGEYVSASARDIPALVAEVRRLRALVESAYREGFYDGEDDAPIGELPAGYGDTAWWMSDARKALVDE